MQKIVFILICVILTAQCSVIRNERSRNIELPGILTKNILETIKDQNITRCSFFIQKAEIEISSAAGKEKVIGNIRYEYPDKYLISIRSRTGIEAVRIFIFKDTILVNDRINRRLYYGTNLYLKKKYGITYSVLPVVLGDFLTDSLSEKNLTKCFNGNLNIDYQVDDITIKFVIDCKKGKSVLAVSESIIDKKEMKISFGRFLKTGNIFFPGNIIFNDLASMTTINVRIKKIEFPWNGHIEFKPGKGYELKKLL